MNTKRIISMMLAIIMLLSFALTAVSCDLSSFIIFEDYDDEDETKKEKATKEETTEADTDDVEDTDEETDEEKTSDTDETETKAEEKTEIESETGYVPGEATTVGGAYYEVPSEGYDGSAVTITFYHTLGRSLQDVLDKYIVEFNKMYPNITIQHSQVGSYDDVRNQITTELTVGNQPNVAYCYPDHVALYNITKAVVPLDSFIESKIEVTDAYGNTSILGLTNEQIADFIPAFYNEGRMFDEKGTMYTLPMSKSTDVLYYNKTFFEANGLTVPATWDELEALCAKILEIDPYSIPLGYDSEANWFITMTQQYGSPYTSNVKGKNFLFNNDQNKAFVKRFREWFQSGYVTTQELYGAYTSDLFTETYRDAKKCYMSIGSSAGAQYQRPAPTNSGYAFEVGIAPMPQVDLANPKVISQGPSLCIFDSENKQEVVATWLFVKFLTTTPELQAEFSMTSGYMPVINSASRLSVYDYYLTNADGGDNIMALAARTAIEQQNAYFTIPAFVGSAVARDQVSMLMQICFATTTNDIDALLDEAFKAAIDECKYQS